MSRQLARELRRRVHAAGGAVGAIRLGPRPLATLPAGTAGTAGTAGAAGGSGLEGRLWRYSEGVKLTVATRLLKESLGLRLVEEDEEKRGLSYDWVLWTREDAHWSAQAWLWPLTLALALIRLAPGPYRPVPSPNRTPAWPSSGLRRSTSLVSRRVQCTARAAAASAAGTTRSGLSRARRPQEASRSAPVAPPCRVPGDRGAVRQRAAEPHIHLTSASASASACGASAYRAPRPWRRWRESCPLAT